jgi:undecaprenyl diphosphate synthase
MENLKINIYGRVQGVGFRKKIKRFADKNNLKGFVENNFDGSVSMFVKCSDKKLNKFLAWLKINKGFSLVKNFELINQENFKNYSGFKIKKKNSFLIDKFKGGFNFLRYFFRLQNPRNYLKKIPLHVVIIPDGNRRWARKKGLNSLLGHVKAGSFENLNKIFNEAKNLGIKYVSIWVFSTENWKRSHKEIKNLFKIFYDRVKDLRKEVNKDKIRFRHIGRKDRIPEKLSFELKKLENESKNNSDFNIQFCLDYGGRDEIIRTINKILKLKIKKISEEFFLDNLDSKGIPDPDLIIRTSAEKRISGFMPFQSVYSELAFVKKNFPDFGPKDLRKVIKNFGERKRRFGGNS